MNVEMHVRFIGRVQGVGFRASAAHAAKRLGLKGTVKNLPDGSVELIAQGPEDNLETLIKELDQNIFPGHIHHVEKKFGPVDQVFSSFSIS